MSYHLIVRGQDPDGEPVELHNGYYAEAIEAADIGWGEICKHTSLDHLSATITEELREEGVTE